MSTIIWKQFSYVGHLDRHMTDCMLAMVHVGIATPGGWGKRSRHSPHMRNLQFCISGKRPMVFTMQILTGLYLSWRRIAITHVTACCLIAPEPRVTYNERCYGVLFSLKGNCCGILCKICISLIWYRGIFNQFHVCIDIFHRRRLYSF